MLVVAGLSKRFPNGAVAVDRLDLEVQEGELIALLGPSGCGKTTTLRCIAGFEDPSAGTITLAGRRIDLLPANRRNATMVFQGYALFPHLSVFENVGYGLRVRRVSGAMLTERVHGALALVGLAGLGDRRPQQLSGGQQQRVALARALVLEPKLLLFDEPLSNLDAKLREQMRLEIRTLQQRVGITSVYVTHDRVEAMTLADRIAVMEGGRVAQLGTPRQIYDEPATRFVAGFIGKANFVPATVTRRAGADLVLDMLGQVRHASSVVGDHPVGAPVTAMIRPEAIELVPAGPDTVPATVVTASFLGGEASYELSCAGQLMHATAAMARGAGLQTAGAAVGLRIGDGAVRVLAD
ncbi:MAG TPA: ABC transporter ATP-binding protein [Candidatus Limnocylindria bacterium]|nr:ABC transporter ATP-binding protein [Candidatus Limnocylindria bacterium]